MSTIVSFSGQKDDNITVSEDTTAVEDVVARASGLVKLTRASNDNPVWINPQRVAYFTEGIKADAPLAHFA